MSELRITVKNTSETGGTFLTPVYFGFHDGSFDLFNAGQAASPGLEMLAEDGGASALAAERLAADPDSQGIVVAGAAGPIATGEVTSARIDVDARSNGSVSLAAMILPSNDAFIGTDEAVDLFTTSGRFKGAQTLTFEGSDVYDAGTEVNTEEDAAFLNQTAPNTGIDENGVVRLHPGFNGSEGNPAGEGDQNILGGTNAFGVPITEEADFTRDGAQIAVVHINTVVDHKGTDGKDLIWGRSDDDIVDAGAGNDFIATRAGWDVIDAGAGHDVVFAGRGDDLVLGGAGHDLIRGGAGEDTLDGGEGSDKINGGSGDDLIAGGTGYDILRGGHGNDTFLFATGDGYDLIKDFDRRGDDQLALAVEGVTSFDDLLDHAQDVRGGLKLDFGDGDALFLRGLDITDLSTEDILFA